LTNTALQVGKLQVTTMHGAVHALHVAYDRLAPSHPSLAAVQPFAVPVYIGRKSQPKLVPIYRPQKDERLGRVGHLRVSTLPQDIAYWPMWQGLN
jgi:hypothetical protein